MSRREPFASLTNTRPSRKTKRAGRSGRAAAAQDSAPQISQRHNANHSPTPADHESNIPLADDNDKRELLEATGRLVCRFAIPFDDVGLCLRLALIQGARRGHLEDDELFLRDMGLEVLDLFPHIKDAIEASNVEDVAVELEAGRDKVRRFDTSRIRHTLPHWNNGWGMTIAELHDKSRRGLRHPIMGPMMLPGDQIYTSALVDDILDPETDEHIDSNKVPRCAYRNNDTTKPAGVYQNELHLKTALALVCGAEASKTGRHSSWSVSRKYRLTKVNKYFLAYTLCMFLSGLSSETSFSIDNGLINYHQTFRAIVKHIDLLRSSDAGRKVFDRKIDTFWNKKLFNGVPTGRGAPDEHEMAASVAYAESLAASFAEYAAQQELDDHSGDDFENFGPQHDGNRDDTPYVEDSPSIENESAFRPTQPRPHATTSAPIKTYGRHNRVVESEPGSDNDEDKGNRDSDDEGAGEDDDEQQEMDQQLSSKRNKVQREESEEQRPSKKCKTMPQLQAPRATRSSSNNKK